MDIIRSFPLQMSGLFANVEVPADSKLLSVTLSESGEWLASYILSDFILSTVIKRFLIVPITKEERKLDIEFFKFFCESDNHLIFIGK